MSPWPLERSTPDDDVTAPFLATRQDRRRPPELIALIWLTVAVVGWVTIGLMAANLLSSRPPSAAFDLELVLRAARAVAAGTSPYDPTIVAGRAPDAVGLFFSYPPPVAQVLVPLSGLPSILTFMIWSLAAVALLAITIRGLAVILGDGRVLPATAVAATVGLSAVTFPFVIAILFGNLDVFFPALYGLALIGILSARRRDGLVGGIAVGVAAAAKLYPGGLGLWFAIRALRDRPAIVPFAAMVATGAALLLASLIVGGLAPWQDYGQVISAATRSDLVDVRNVSPAAQLALLVGGDSGLARLIQVPVAALAVLAIGWAAWTRRDPVESLAIAAAATLILLPISWIHYPAAMIPFAAAAVLRTVGADGSVSREIRLAVTTSIVVADAALIFLPLMWLAVALCVFAVHRSVPPTAVESDRSPTPAAALAR